jgi:hypothetical protein
MILSVHAIGDHVEMNLIVGSASQFEVYTEKPAFDSESEKHPQRKTCITPR